MNSQEWVQGTLDEAMGELLKLHGGRSHSCPDYDYDGDLDEYARFYDHEACPVVRLLAYVRAQAYRDAAADIEAHPGPHHDEHQPDAPGFWWDTRDRDAAAEFLRLRAAETVSVCLSWSPVDGKEKG